MQRNKFIGMIAAGAFALAALAAHATPTSEIAVFVRDVPPQTIVGGHPDVLGLDFKITAPRGDILDALTVEQAGTAQWQTDLTEAELWRDAGPAGFQGIGVDASLGTGRWVASEHGWAFDRIFVPVSESGTRFFVTYSTTTQPTNGATVRLSIPAYFDAFQPMSYDTGDRGIFLRTARPAPLQEGLTVATWLFRNWSVHTVTRRATDDLPPIVRTTEPADGASFNRNWLLVRGVAQDVGGSAVAKVLLGVNRVGRAITWVEAIPEAPGFATWEARLFGLPAPTMIELRVQAEDWVGNRSAVSAPVTVTLTQ